MEDEFDCAASALLGYSKAVFEEGSFRLDIADHRQRRQLDFSRAVSKDYSFDDNHHTSFIFERNRRSMMFRVWIHWCTEVKRAIRAGAMVRLERKWKAYICGRGGEKGRKECDSRRLSRPLVGVRRDGWSNDMSLSSLCDWLLGDSGCSSWEIPLKFVWVVGLGRELLNWESHAVLGEETRSVLTYTCCVEAARTICYISFWYLFLIKLFPSFWYKWRTSRSWDVLYNIHFMLYTTSAI